ncbi:hypothetical protein, partial [Kitasatospora purpeofusca]|uniref:hypothetical protein n=1 Tax=Kitasatospora purpeofusca TaxID=67352 RepID=UPI0035DFF9B1
KDRQTLSVEGRVLFGWIGGVWVAVFMVGRSFVSRPSDGAGGGGVVRGAAPEGGAAIGGR